MWLSAERGRAPSTIAAYRRDLRTYVAWLRERGTRRSTEVTEADLRRLRRRRSAIAGLAPASVARAAGAGARAAPVPRRRGPRADRPGRPPRAAQGAPGPAQGAQRGGGRPAARRAGGRRPGRAARPGHARGALRHRRAGVGAGRAVASATSTSTPRCSAPSARGARSGSCRSACHAVRALVAWLGPGRAAARWRPAQWRRRGDAEAVFLNARGGRLTRQGAWDVLTALRPPGGPRGQAQPARAAPLLRHPHARPRRRHPGRAGAARATPRSARRRCTRWCPPSGCGRCTATLTRGRSTGSSLARWPTSPCSRPCAATSTDERDRLEAQIASLEPGHGRPAPTSTTTSPTPARWPPSRARTRSSPPSCAASSTRSSGRWPSSTTAPTAGCETCGEPISPARLEAMPAARFCIEHA